MFKAVLITTSRIPFKLEPDIPEELEGRTNWAKRNYEYHKDKADTLKLQLKEQENSPVWRSISEFPTQTDDPTS